ncbi:RNA polymerase sigma-70 factor [Phytoactinopolyspora mesophila]|uniref:RNA polymerase sigma-70 factor n=1 Tax=Phytoactinopolyspora mesophila TaxID=2650750 RepID=A0A7K3MAM0_9ACTN|nr:RNA polymerase sigma-70 factor [Phytoactinopolyspora mesophila]NDL60344.1 RNA polymerase sigma-70 factor [Phytoactinopolyspora mesophila]
MSVSELYGGLRPRAFAIAYQMLGSVGEAEDLVQEAFLRMHQVEQRGETINSPRAYIATMVTRLAIDQLRSARAQREQYIGEWLPEPLATEPTPAEKAETADSLSLAFLVLLESLTPQQRAAFLLREVFEYPYPEVAEIIGTDVDSARHLVARARNHVRERRPRHYASRRQREELAQRFFAAAQQGDMSALEEMLAQDVALHADGGGKAPVHKQPIFGRTRVARALSKGIPILLRRGGRIELTEVNGQPGAVAFDEHDQLIGVMELDVADGQIQAINSVANPDKLQHLAKVGPLGVLLLAGLRSGDET